MRARITDDPVAYRWSSCAAHLGQRAGSLLTPHPAWLALDSDPARRAIIWRGLLDDALTSEQIVEIRAYLQQQRAWGRDDFRAMIEAKTRRFAGVRPAHRPSKADK